MPTRIPRGPPTTVAGTEPGAFATTVARRPRAPTTAHRRGERRGVRGPRRAATRRRPTPTRRIVVRIARVPRAMPAAPRDSQNALARGARKRTVAPFACSRTCAYRRSGLPWLAVGKRVYVRARNLYGQHVALSRVSTPLRYRAAWWVPGAHLRTLWGKMIRLRQHVDTRCAQWTSTLGDPSWPRGLVEFALRARSTRRST